MEDKVFPVWSFGKVHDFEFFWLNTQADVCKSFLEERVGILEPGYVGRERGGGGEKATIIHIC